jgi:FAD/FMN-containing dehydrogenase
MNRIVEWDPESGEIEVESGATIADIWRRVISDGYWLPVVSGTMVPTIGGALGMNIHGKNCWAAGPIGEHVLSIRVVFPNGVTMDCGPDRASEVFYAVIGSFGTLGCIVRARLRLKKIHSGRIKVRAFCTPNLDAMFSCLEEHIDSSHYLVGWIDALKGGGSLGRGVVHVADYPEAGDDPKHVRFLTAKSQELPKRLFGLIPKSWMWRFLKPFTNRLGIKFLNAVKYRLSCWFDKGKPNFQTLSGFNFLLDYVPNWKWVYGPGGFIQHQTFVPKEHALRVFSEILKISHVHKMPPFLAVFKRHRPDAFLLTHALDGYSLALDFPINKRTRAKMLAMTAEIDELVVDAGGRFYAAKDATLTAETYRRSLPPVVFEQYGLLKRRFDPDNILQSDLSRRWFDAGPHNKGITG